MRTRDPYSNIDTPRSLVAAIVVAALLMAWIAVNVVLMYQREVKQDAIIDAIVTTDKAISSQELSGVDADAAVFCLDNQKIPVRTQEGIRCQ